MLGRLYGFVCVAVLAAFAATPASAQKANWPKSLTLGTASVGGTFFIYGQVWATLAGDTIGVPISTQQTQGPNQNIILVESKQIELGMTTMGIAFQAWKGEGAWTQGKKFQSVRAIFPMYDTPFHFITTDKTGIKSVKDLNGRAVGVGPRAGTPGTYFPLMFEALGVKPSAIRFGGASDMGGQLGDGLLDTFAFAAGLPISAFSEIEAQRSVVFFSFSQDEIKTLTSKFPELAETKIPANTYKSLKEDQPTVGVFNFAIAHKDLPDDLVYEIVKAVMDNNQRMVTGHAAAVETIPANAAKNTFLPFHPGAARYFREKGIAIPDNLVMR
jgi:TRAP transporter TAXI family solute receptor